MVWSDDVLRKGRHVVDAGHRRDVELELQRRLAVVRGLRRARAQRLLRQPAKDWSQRLLHAGHEDAEHLLQLAPVLQDREDLADAEDELCAAVHVEPRVCHEGDDGGDHLPPERTAVRGHDGLPRCRHDHLHGVASNGLAVLLSIRVRPLREWGYGRQVVQSQEAQDLLARLRVEREVPRREEDQAARSAAQEQGLEPLRVVRELWQQLNELRDDGILPGRRARSHARQHKHAGINVLPGDRLARTDLLEQRPYVVYDPAGCDDEAGLRNVYGAQLPEADKLVPLKEVLPLGFGGVADCPPVRLDHPLDVGHQNGFLR
mmetsp:Transcript_59085/g.175757  ORF Transcript_59085/g.175757 Transcript_59085/m.175757 type:complete len:318 (-) Transcript_59085:309-1262(-)